MTISIGEFHLKKLTLAPEFIKLSQKIHIESQESKGNIHSEIKNVGLKKFYSFSAWETREDMLNFMKSGQHSEAMKKSEKYAKEFSLLSFESLDLPSIDSVINTLIKSENKRTFLF